MPLVFQAQIQNENLFIPIFEGETSFGRSEKNDFKLNDSTLSRNHFKCRYKDGLLFIKDNGSKNGIYLNEKKIFLEEVMSFDDILKAGTCFFKLQNLNSTPSAIINQLKNYEHLCLYLGALNKPMGGNLTSSSPSLAGTDTIQLEQMSHKKNQENLRRHVNFKKFLDKKEAQDLQEKRLIVFLRKISKKIKTLCKKIF